MYNVTRLASENYLLAPYEQKLKLLSSSQNEVLNLIMPNQIVGDANTNELERIFKIHIVVVNFYGNKADVFLVG